MGYGWEDTLSDSATGEALDRHVLPLLRQRGYAAVEELVDAEPVGELTLKGFSRPVGAWSIRGLAAAPSTN